MVAPAYSEDTYINHDLSHNLDSTDAFEGPEKLLEIWLSKSPSDLPKGSPEDGLRSIPLEKWEEMLDLVNCKVLSMKSDAGVDAYLLSESSLFVFPHKIVLKTCGTTTTLLGLSKFFEFARAYLEWNLQTSEVHKVFYSRRSFMFPHKQKPIHRSWTKEVEFLEEFFPDGKSYIVGSEDNHQWHLYVAGSSGNEKDDSVPNKDQTFEILMTELDKSKAAAFHIGRVGDDSGHTLGTETLQVTKINEIYPEPAFGKINHDAFSFMPCGYSSNSISGDNYYTLHVTPEDGWSYASFESNFSGVPATGVLDRVLDVFKPGKFCLTLIEESPYFGSVSEVLVSKISHVSQNCASGNSSDNDEDLDGGLCPSSPDSLQHSEPNSDVSSIVSSFAKGEHIGKPTMSDNFKQLYAINLKGYQLVDKTVYDLEDGYCLLYMSFAINQ